MPCSLRMATKSSATPRSVKVDVCGCAARATVLPRRLERLIDEGEPPELSGPVHLSGELTTLHRRPRKDQGRGGLSEGVETLSGTLSGARLSCYFLPVLPVFLGAGFLAACGLRAGCFFTGTYPSVGTLPDEPVLSGTGPETPDPRNDTATSPLRIRQSGGPETGWRMIVFSFAGSVVRGSPR